MHIPLLTVSSYELFERPSYTNAWPYYYVIYSVIRVLLKSRVMEGSLVLYFCRSYAEVCLRTEVAFFSNNRNNKLVLRPFLQDSPVESAPEQSAVLDFLVAPGGRFVWRFSLALMYWSQSLLSLCAAPGYCLDG